MSGLVAERTRTIREAQRIIGEANRYFDEQSLSLSRQCNLLRAQLALLQPVEPAPERTRSVTVKHDPDWSQEDIDHFYELQRRGNKTSA